MNFLDSDFSFNSKFPPSFHCHYRDYYDEWLSLSDHYSTALQKVYSPLPNSDIVNHSIPRHVHQIWLGSKYPKKYLKWRNSWLEKNPELTMTIWDEEMILDLPLLNRKAFINAKNYGMKSDIARYEILFLFGGLYVDTDFECLQRFPDYIFNFSFFAGTVFSYRPQINNAIIGSIPNHPFLELIINGINSNFLFDHMNDPEMILATTGANYISKLWYEYQGSSPDHSSIIFPSNYFYPVPNFTATHLHKPSFYSEISFAEHHWEVSWMSKPYIKRVISKLLRIWGN